MRTHGSTEKVTVTYKVKMPERVKKYHTFHVNLLKAFQVRQEPVHQLLVRAVQQEEEVDEKFFPDSIVDSSPLELSHLSASQQEDAVPFLDPGLFREMQGFITLVRHKILLKVAPVRQRSYKIPERLVPVLKK